MFCALSWSEHPPPRTYDEAYARLDLDRPPLAALARPRRVPRPSVAERPAAQRPDAQGPDLRADRRDRRRRHHLAAGDAGRRAQLGLPLLVDPRLHVRAVGPLHARLRLGGERLLLLRRRRGRGRAGPAADHVRHRRRAPTCRSARSTTCPATRTRGPCGSATPRYDQDQHDVWGAVLDSFYLHTRSRDHLPERFWPIALQQVEMARRELARAGPRASGRCAASRSTSPRRSSCAGWRSIAARGSPSCARSWDRAARWRSVADEIHADICANALDERGVFTQHYDTDGARRLGPAHAARALPAARRRARPRHRAGHRRRADRRTGSCCATASRRPTTGWRARRGRSRSARSGSCRRCARSARSTRARDLCEKLLAYSSDLGLYAEEIDPRTGRHLGQLPAGVHAPRADQRGDARDPRGGRDAGAAVRLLRRARRRRGGRGPRRPAGAVPARRLAVARARTLVVILAGGAGGRLELLTHERAKPAVSFAGTHRLIDFSLSNCTQRGLSRRVDGAAVQPDLAQRPPGQRASVGPRPHRPAGCSSCSRGSATTSRGRVPGGHRRRAVAQRAD